MNSKIKADILIKNASEILTCRLKKSNEPKTRKALSDIGIIYNGSIAIKNGKIIFVGKSKNCKIHAKKIVNATGKVVMPGFVDCHTHAVFAGSREDEFLRKLKGESYLNILKSGGGILNTVKKTRKATKRELLKVSISRVKKMLEYGTTTVEIKSGYGLTFKDEKKILEVASLLSKNVPIDVVRTYLGAHAVPKNISKEKYLKEVLLSLKKIKSYAEFCDVFCEKGVFSVKETKEILTSAKRLGFKLKLHSEQLSRLNSAQLAAKLGAVSADHLEHISSEGMKALQKNKVIGVLLPGVSFFLMSKKYPNARELIKKGVAVAIASDFNPGSCPSFNMQLMILLSCLKMKMLPEEAINAATINAAFAIGKADEIGSLEIGKKADVIILGTDTHRKLPYYFGINFVEKVIKNGKLVFSKKVS